MAVKRRAAGETVVTYTFKDMIHAFVSVAFVIFAPVFMPMVMVIVP